MAITRLILKIQPPDLNNTYRMMMTMIIMMLMIRTMMMIMVMKTQNSNSSAYFEATTSRFFMIIHINGTYRLYFHAKS